MTKCAPKQKRVFIIFPKKMKTHSSHCSDHSAWAPDFALTDVWNFSFPKLIVTNASFVPFFPFTLRPLARFTNTWTCVGLHIFSFDVGQSPKNCHSDQSE